MTTILAPGANCGLSKTNLLISFNTGQIQTADIDVSAFLVAENGKVRSDDDMCFYGQKTVGGGALLLQEVINGRAVFALDLGKMPRSIEKIVFTSTVHENRATFGSIPEITYQAGNVSGRIPCAGRSETALMIAEVYRRNGQWKIKTIGQGFNGGLEALARHLGVDIASPQPSTTPAAHRAPEPSPGSVRTPGPEHPPSQPRLNLSKVSLTKTNTTVSLTKSDGRFGKIRVNLNWNQKQASSGLLGGLLGTRPLDLDLGCLVEDRYGNRACVQALGGGFGDFDYFPYVRLQGDDRTGAVRDGEWLDINGQMWGEFNRVLIFAFIYDGAPNWQQTDGVIRLLIPEQPEVEVRMNEYGSKEGMCAVAMLENERSRIKVSREVRFFPGHRRMDEHFGWGMNWIAGSK